jgi:predicted DNA-binding protein
MRKLYDEPQKLRAFRQSEAQFDAIAKVAKARGVTVSACLREAVEDYLKKTNDHTDQPST